MRVRPPRRPHPARTRGTGAVLGAATLWGLSGVVAKTLFTEGIAPQTLVAIRLSGAAALCLSYAAFRGAGLRQAWAHKGRVAALGTCLAASQFAYYAAIASSGVAPAIFLQYLAPALLVVWARATGAEPLSPARVGAVLLASCGAFLLVAGPAGLAVTPAGLGWGLASAALFAAYTVLARQEVARADSWAVLALALAAGAVAWSAVVPPWEAWTGTYSPSQWARFAHLAVLATVLPFGLFLYGLRTTSPATAGLLATTEPLVAAVTAHVALRESFSLQQALGGALILAAVVWTHREALPDSPPPSPGGQGSARQRG